MTTALEKKFIDAQEGVRKCVKRIFGVLFGSFLLFVSSCGHRQRWIVLPTSVLSCTTCVLKKGGIANKAIEQRVSVGFLPTRNPT